MWGLYSADRNGIHVPKERYSPCRSDSLVPGFAKPKYNSPTFPLAWLCTHITCFSSFIMRMFLELLNIASPVIRLRRCVCEGYVIIIGHHYETMLTLSRVFHHVSAYSIVFEDIKPLHIRHIKCFSTDVAILYDPEQVFISRSHPRISTLKKHSWKPWILEYGWWFLIYAYIVHCLEY